MALLFPTAAVPKAYDITADSLRALDIKGLILDIDNTLTTHDHPLAGRTDPAMVGSDAGGRYPFDSFIQ